MMHGPIGIDMLRTSELRHGHRSYRVIECALQNSSLERSFLLLFMKKPPLLEARAATVVYLKAL